MYYNTRFYYCYYLQYTYIYREIEYDLVNETLNVSLEYCTFSYYSIMIWGRAARIGMGHQAYGRDIPRDPS